MTLLSSPLATAHTVHPAWFLGLRSLGNNLNKHRSACFFSHAADRKVCCVKKSLPAEVSLLMFHCLSLLLMPALCSRPRTPSILECRGLLLTIKLSLIIVPCVCSNWLAACHVHSLTRSIALLLSVRPLWSRSVIIHAAVSLGNFVEMTACDHRKPFRYLSLRSKPN